MIAAHHGPLVTDLDTVSLYSTIIRKTIDRKLLLIPRDFQCSVDGTTALGFGTFLDSNNSGD